jgi:hypothetical protein
MYLLAPVCVFAFEICVQRVINFFPATHVKDSAAELYYTPASYTLNPILTQKYITNIINI